MGLNDIRKKRVEDLRKLRKERIASFNRAVKTFEDVGGNEITRANLVIAMDAWIKVDMEILAGKFFDLLEED